MALQTTARRRLLSALGGIGAATLLALGLTSAPGHAAEGTVLGASDPDAIPGSYLVVLEDQVAAGRGVPALAGALTGTFGGDITYTYDAALHGFAIEATARAARRIAAHPSVAYVEQDLAVQLAETQTNPPSWGLDRIDQRNLPLDSSYTYPGTASNVEIHILDTGIRQTHNTFGGRAQTGFDAITPGGSASDCHGHGTHVAGTAAGSEYGVAKGAQVFAVRVLDCNGSGSTTGIVAGINWVTQNADRPAVANMSLGGPGNSVAMNNAVRNSIASGITYAIAAGNSNANACNFSPALVSTALTVGSTTINDTRSGFSNFGTCVDIFAPGSSITSAWWTSDFATNTISGTSMATPHIAGGAALVLAANPSFSPAQVASELVSGATTGAVGNPGPGSPNRLLFVASDGEPPPPPPPPPPGVEPWEAFTSYPVGARVSYEGDVYECRQAHTSLPGWEPPNVLALWLPVS